MICQYIIEKSSLDTKVYNKLNGLVKEAMQKMEPPTLICILFSLYNIKIFLL